MVCDVYIMFFTLIFLNKLKIPKNHEPEIHCCDYIYITDSNFVLYSTLC